MASFVYLISSQSNILEHFMFLKHMSTFGQNTKEYYLYSKYGSKEYGSDSFRKHTRCRKRKDFIQYTLWGKPI